MIKTTVSLLCDTVLIMAHLVFSNTARKKGMFSKLFLCNTHLWYIREIHQLDTMMDHHFSLFPPKHLDYYSMCSLVTSL